MDLAFKSYLVCSWWDFHWFCERTKQLLWKALELRSI